MSSPVAYGRENAPIEEGQPNGLFWAGERFEEDVIVPYLQDIVTTENTYVQNSKWIDTSIETGNTELRLRGSTDPLIVTGDGTPLLVTEVKTKSSIEQLEKPDRRHKAQLHAYLYALDEEFDVSVRDGVLIYGSRTTFDIETFHVQFSEDFWASVVGWMETQTQYRVNDEFPPADPATDWECNYCSYRNRCGQTDVPYENLGFDGLIPGFSGYRKQQIKEYLDAASDEKLTPTLAEKYPELTQEFGVKDWVCHECETHVAWSDLEGSKDEGHAPICKACAKGDRGLHTLYVPINSD